MTQEPLNRVIIFWKRHNILERYYFGTRKHIEVGLISSKNECERYVFAKCLLSFAPVVGVEYFRDFSGGKGVFLCFCD